MMRNLVSAVLGMVVCIAWQGNGWAQAVPVSDALQCFKVTARTVTDDATLTLDPLRPDFPGGACIVRGRIRYVCTPVARTPAATGSTAAIATDFTCYKIRCPGVPRPTDRAVSDDLGTDVPTSHYTTQLVCLPAQLGSTTSSTTSTSTSTTTLAPPPCDQLTAQCVRGSGTCPADQECGSVSSGHCGCIPRLPKACGDTAPDQCGTGVCPQGLECATFGGECACIDPGLVLCGNASVPQCDGVCPSGQVCSTFDFGCACWVNFGPCGQSGFNNSAPACNGDCPSPAAPYCRQVGGTCACAP